eukprot:247520-Chlamydomonas_euryale.AAC.1
MQHPDPACNTRTQQATPEPSMQHPNPAGNARACQLGGQRCLHLVVRLTARGGQAGAAAAAAFQRAGRAAFQRAAR